MHFVAKAVIGVLVAMAIVIAISLIMQAVIHSGTSEKGPFVGTWQSNDQSARLVVDGGPDSYSGTLVSAQAAASVSSFVTATSSASTRARPTPWRGQ